MMHSFDASKATIEALTKHSVIPDVINPNFVKPLGVLSAEYSKAEPVAMGNQLTIKGTQSKPTVHFAPERAALKPSDLLTLVVTDPDAPSRTEKKWSEFCHYVESDIKISETEGGILENGKVLQSYVGPAPPPGTGPHRYVFLLYRQPVGVTASKLTEIKGRPNWGYGTPATGVEKWATENNLEPLGANFFFAESS